MMSIVVRNNHVTGGQTRARLHYDPTGAAERSLWQSVLLEMMHDLCAQTHKHQDRKSAERWVGRYPDHHFQLVCSLAGLDYQAVWDRMHAISQLPPEERDWPGDFVARVTLERNRWRAKHGMAA